MQFTIDILGHTRHTQTNIRNTQTRTHTHIDIHKSDITKLTANKIDDERANLLLLFPLLTIHNKKKIPLKMIKNGKLFWNAMAEHFFDVFDFGNEMNNSSK